MIDAAHAAARDARREISVYVHIPFCAHRCDYCAFATWTDKAHLIDRYVDACCTAIRRARHEGVLHSAATVFVGGGTPSLIGGPALSRILDALELGADTEVTVECNPESTTPALLNALRSSGVNRISLGVQSLHQHVLDGLGREAAPALAGAAVAMIGAAGFTNFNVDVIFGGAGETTRQFEETLSGILSFDPSPPHVSAYALTVEAGTPLARDARRHPDDDVLASRYERCDDVLTAAGFDWYEVSNWARSGFECRHNLAGWAQGNYLGIGASAHSHIAGTRTINERTPERYIEAIEQHRSAVVAREVLGAAERAMEALFLALRTRAGVPNEALPDDEALTGLIERGPDRAVLTRRGRLLCNEVACRLVIPPAPAHESDRFPTLRGVFAETMT